MSYKLNSKVVRALKMDDMKGSNAKRLDNYTLESASKKLFKKK